jgi:hypothetical protein
VDEQIYVVLSEKPPCSEGRLDFSGPRDRDDHLVGLQILPLFQLLGPSPDVPINEWGRFFRSGKQNSKHRTPWILEGMMDGVSAPVHNQANS